MVEARNQQRDALLFASRRASTRSSSARRRFRRTRARSAATSACSSAPLNATRMKKMPVSVSSNCCASRMLNPPSNKAVETLATIPGRSAQDSVRTWRAADMGGKPFLEQARRSACAAPLGVRGQSAAPARRKGACPSAGRSPQAEGRGGADGAHRCGSAKQVRCRARRGLARSPTRYGLTSASDAFDRRQDRGDDLLHAFARRVQSVALIELGIADRPPSRKNG